MLLERYDVVCRRKEAAEESGLKKLWASMAAGIQVAAPGGESAHCPQGRHRGSSCSYIPGKLHTSGSEGLAWVMHLHHGWAWGGWVRSEWNILKGRLPDLVHREGEAPKRRKKKNWAAVTKRGRHEFRAAETYMCPGIHFITIDRKECCVFKFLFCKIT